MGTKAKNLPKGDKGLASKGGNKHGNWGATGKVGNKYSWKSAGKKKSDK